MASKAAIDQFIAERSLAIVGVSRNNIKFGNMIYKELKKNGYKVFAVNPKADTIEGDPCYPDLASLPEKVGGVVVVLPPNKAEQAVKDAAQAGIKKVWLQQGSQSKAAIEFCQKNGISVVAGECLFMYAEPVATFHKFHRFFKFLFGGKPK
jgi:predicted CoA-binding protein